MKKNKYLERCEKLLPEIELKANQLINSLKEYGFKIKKPYIENLEDPKIELVLIKFNIIIVYQGRNIVNVEFVACPVDKKKFEYSAYILEGKADTLLMRNFITEMHEMFKKKYYSFDDMAKSFLNRNKETFVSFRNLINR